MGKNRIIATYRINSDECIQAQVDAVSAYPDALAEATATARRLVHDMLADVLELTRDAETVTEAE